MTPQQSHRQGELSVGHIRYTEEDLAIVAKEINDGTVSDIIFPLFVAWVSADRAHYDRAKRHIRELACDQGYAADRAKNDYIRVLLEECHEYRTDLPGYVANDKSLKVLKTRNTSSPAFSPTLSSVKSEMRGASQPMPKSPWSASSKFSRSPPNTPDRPAPLFIRSRGSSGLTPTTTPKSAQFRSVSSPVYASHVPSRTSSMCPINVLEATASLASMSLQEEDESGWESEPDDHRQPEGERRHPLASGTRVSRQLFAGKNGGSNTPLEDSQSITRHDESGCTESAPMYKPEPPPKIPSLSARNLHRPRNPNTLSGLFEYVEDFASSNDRVGRTEPHEESRSPTLSTDMALNYAAERLSYESGLTDRTSTACASASTSTSEQKLVKSPTAGSATAEPAVAGRTKSKSRSFRFRKPKLNFKFPDATNPYSGVYFEQPPADPGPQAVSRKAAHPTGHSHSDSRASGSATGKNPNTGTRDAALATQNGASGNIMRQNYATKATARNAAPTPIAVGNKEEEDEIDLHLELFGRPSRNREKLSLVEFLRTTAPTAPRNASNNDPSTAYPPCSPSQPHPPRDSPASPAPATPCMPEFQRGLRTTTQGSPRSPPAGPMTSHHSPSPTQRPALQTSGTRSPSLSRFHFFKDDSNPERHQLNGTCARVPDPTPQLREPGTRSWRRPPSSLYSTPDAAPASASCGNVHPPPPPPPPPAADQSPSSPSSLPPRRKSEQDTTPTTHLAALLARTRARGNTLPGIYSTPHDGNADADPDETPWLLAHRDVLEAIYATPRVLLPESEKALIEIIAALTRAMRDASAGRGELHAVLGVLMGKEGEGV